MGFPFRLGCGWAEWSVYWWKVWKERDMTTISLELPESIAVKAEEAGLLQAGRMAQILEQELRREAAKRFADYSRRFREAGGIMLSEEEVMAEVKAMRAENRERRALPK